MHTSVSATQEQQQDIVSQDTNPIQYSIQSKISTNLQPSIFKIYNDSHKHAHHAGLRGASNVTESHFRLTIVSDAFKGLGLPARHRLIYKLLDDEIKIHGVHALQLKTKTPDEWDREMSKEK
ncbi:hypothetical protein CANARDRAFT_198060 [[Candida] arabinofermentans NRRL YB-2248]|uniref:Bola-like protein n=1 Tax=[Candida] arabinofermentans NRRL YB-2248 TaxID=983967 RepID=A0A1E4T1T2_9ASCO|nr:hypothetical protein CANARDRAFT_198060 [[Candida] arabinofermentans NRRL YB-2248]